MKLLRHTLGLLLATLLVAGQWAGMLHGMGHAAHELAVAKAAVGGGDPAPLDHARDHCVAFHALDGSLAGVLPPCLPPQARFAHSVVPPQPAHAAWHFPFRSRAPPVLS